MSDENKTPAATEETGTEETQVEGPEMPAEAEEEKLPGAEIRVTEVRPGMTIRVHERVKDLNPKGEERERIQIFQGVVIGLRGVGLSKTMTIRREHKGYGVEKIYPLKSPTVSKIEVVKIARTRRAKLTFLQNQRRRFKRKLKEQKTETR